MIQVGSVRQQEKIDIGEEGKRYIDHERETSIIC